MKLYLSIIDTNGKKKTFPVTSLHTTIGRSKRSKIQIADDLCSGVHCKVFIENDCVFVEDAGSKNGVFLNEIKVKKQRIYIGDEVRIGSTKIKLDHTKMSNEEQKAHTSEHSNRANGSITLELESFQETKKKNTQKLKKQKEYVKNAKLYEGVSEDTNKKKRETKKLILLERLAGLVDLSLTLAILIGPIAYNISNDKKIMAKIMKDPAQLFVGQNLFFLIGGLIGAIIFFKWNRSREKGTIGEMIFNI